MSDKFTPGPWISPWDQPDESKEQTGIYTADGKPVVVPTYYDQPLIEMTEADARLIAQAPALYEIAKDFDVWLQCLGDDEYNYLFSSDNGREMVRRLRAAIAGVEDGDK